MGRLIDNIRNNKSGNAAVTDRNGSSYNSSGSLIEKAKKNREEENYRRGMEIYSDMSRKELTKQYDRFNDSYYDSYQKDSRGKNIENRTTNDFLLQIGDRILKKAQDRSKTDPQAYNDISQINNMQNLLNNMNTTLKKDSKYWNQFKSEYDYDMFKTYGKSSSSDVQNRVAELDDLISNNPDDADELSKEKSWLENNILYPQYSGYNMNDIVSKINEIDRILKNTKDSTAIDRLNREKTWLQGKYDILNEQYEKAKSEYEQKQNELEEQWIEDNSSGNFLKALGNALFSGISGVNNGLTQFTDATLGTMIRFSEENPVAPSDSQTQSTASKYLLNKWDNYVKDAEEGYLDTVTQVEADKLKYDNKAASVGLDVAAGVGSAIPSAVMTLVTQGMSSLSGVGAAGSATAASAAVDQKISEMVAGYITSAAKDPQYWMSFSQMAGDTYYTAKQEGASDSEAMAAALLNGTIGSFVEIGSGYQTQVGKANTVKNFIKSAIEEGNEEVIQGIFENATKKVVYDKDREVFSLSDDDAVINPLRSAKEFSIGAAAGGIMTGPVMASNVAANNLAINHQYKNCGQYILESNQADALIEQALTFDKNTAIFKMADALQKQVKDGNVNTRTLGRLYANIYSEASNETINEIGSLLETQGLDKSEISDVKEIARKMIDGETLTNEEINMVRGDSRVSEVFKNTFDYLPGDISEKASTTSGNNSVTNNTNNSYIEIGSNTEEFNEINTDSNFEENVKTEPELAVNNNDLGESHYDENGNEYDAVLNTTGDDVNISRYESTGKNATCVLEDGSSVPASELILSDSMELINDAVADYSVNAANAMLTAYKTAYRTDINNGGAELYVKTWDGFYQYGKTNAMTYEEALDSGLADILPDVVSKAAFEWGVKDNMAEVESKQRNLKKRTNSKKEKSKGSSVESISREEAEKYNVNTVSMDMFNEKQQASYSVMDAIGKAMGIKIYFFEDSNTDNKIHGFYKSGSIYLNIDAGHFHEQATLRTAAHELTHYIKDASPKLYEELKTFIVEQYHKGDKDTFTALVNDKKESLKLSIQDAVDEVIADSCEMMLNDSSVIETLVNEHKTLFEKILDFISGLVEKIKTAFEGVEESSMAAVELKKILGDWTELRNIWDDALVDASNNMVANEENIVKYKKGEMYSKDNLDNFSSRYILASALLETAYNSEERENLKKYQKAVKKINDMEARLDMIKSAIRSLSYDYELGAPVGNYRSKVAELKKSGQALIRSIEYWDKQLLNLQSTTPLKNLMERQREVLSKKYMNEAKTKLDDSKARFRASNQRNMIKQNAKSLIRWINKPDNTHYVPDGLKKPILEFLASIDFISDRANPESFTSKDWMSKMAAVKNALEDIQLTNNDIDSEFIDVLDPELIYKIKEFMNNNSDIVILSRCNPAQTEQIHQIICALKQAVLNSNKLRANMMSESVMEVVDMTISELNKHKQKKELNGIIAQADKLMNMDMLDSRSYFKSLGKGAMSIYEELRNGFNERVWKIDNAKNYMEKNLLPDKSKKERKKLLNKWTGPKAETHEFTVADKTIRLTSGQLMNLYCLAKRTQAMEHMIRGGIKIENQGKIKGNVEAVHVTEEILNNWFSKLSEEQIKTCEMMQSYLSTEVSGWGNEVSEKMYGYKKFTEKNYWPIKVDNNTIKSGDKDVNDGSLYKLKNMGFTKSTEEKVTNAIMIEDVFDVFSNHVAEMANYNAYVIPLADAMKWYNFKSTVEVEPGVYESITVKKQIEKAYGRNAKTYFLNLIKDINGGEKAEKSIAEKLVSNYKASAVGFNLRVAIQQATAYVRAAAVINPIYLTKALTHKPAVRECQENSAIALWKSMGYFETNLGQSMKRIITGENDTVMSSLKEVSMIIPQLADDMTWGVIWNAVKEEQKAVHKGIDVKSEEFMEYVRKRYDEVIDQTQVVDTVLHRSQIMRSKNALNQMATSFMAEPTKTYNLVRNALVEFADSPDKKKSAANISRVIATYLVTGFTTAVAQSIVDAFRNAGKDDQDDKWINRFREALIGDGGGNFVDTINPLGMIPYVKEVLSLIDGFSSARLDTAGAETVVNAIKSLNKFINDENYNKNAYYIIRYFAKAASQITGVSVYNLMRDFEGIYNTFSEEPITYSKPTESGLTSKAAEYYISGNGDKAKEYYEKLKVQIANKYKGYSSAKVEDTARSKVKSKISSEFKDEYLESDETCRDEIMRNMLNTGMYEDEEEIKDICLNWEVNDLKNQYISTDDEAEIKKIRDKLLNTGMWDTAEDMDAAIAKWVDMDNSGPMDSSLTSKIAEFYISGDYDKAQEYFEDLKMQISEEYPGYSNSKVEDTARSKVKSKISSEFKDEYLEADETRRDEIKQDMLNTGIYEDDEVKDIFINWEVNELKNQYISTDNESEREKIEDKLWETGKWNSYSKMKKTIKRWVE